MEGRCASLALDALASLPVQITCDLAQAFPGVARNWLFAVLRSVNLPPPLLAFYQMLYTGVRYFGQIGGSLTLLFPVFSGVIQGRPGGAALFALAMDPVV